MVDDSGLENLPRFQFNKFPNLTAHEVKAIEGNARQYSVIPAEKSIPISPERAEAIKVLVQNQVDWAKERLGISLDKRMPWMEKIRYFSSDIYKTLDTVCDGIHTPITNDISLPEQPTEEKTLVDTNHELVHQFSRQLLSVHRRSDGWRNIESYFLGYQHNGKFQFFNEIITEMVNAEQLQFLLETKGIDYTQTQRGYHPGLLFFDMVLDKVSSSLNIDRREMQADLYRGLFKGDMTVIRPFRSVFDHETVQILADFDRTYATSAAVLGVFADKFGINEEEYRQKVTEYEQGKEVEFLGGMKIKTSPIAKTIEKESIG